MSLTLEFLHSYNPQRHFRLFGIKLMALNEIKRLKLSRNEQDFAKDILDAVRIDQVLENQ